MKLDIKEREEEEEGGYKAANFNQRSFPSAESYSSGKAGYKFC